MIMSISSALANNTLNGLVKRILPGHENQFVFHIENSKKQLDFFELSNDKAKIVIKANNPVSAAAGLNWYLKYYCQSSITFCGDQLSVPDQLPKLKKKVRKETSLTKNFYLNYCTFSYTTAYWDWDRWEREIDWMALNGINTPMAMVGVEAVWRNTLKQFNYSDKEIKEFLCGPSFFGWLLMDNLEGHGGPLPDEWFDRQIALQKKIVARMREYGMTPVFQSFFGMVPNSLSKKYPKASIIAQGNWQGFKRPPVLLSTDPLFKEMASVWYKEYEKLYGRTTSFGGDLFHEGGRTNGIDVSKIANGVQKCMTDYNKDAQWYIQCWGNNPTESLLSGLDKRHTVIIDLAAEFWQRWKERDGFNGFPWVWSHLTNYGGNIGLHGRLKAISEGVLAGKKDKIASVSMIGTSSTPEGTEINPVAFDLGNEMRWYDQTVDMFKWLDNYAHRRYGTENASLQNAWHIFYETAYGSFEGHRRPSESVFCAKPSLKGNKITASAWSQCKIFYDPTKYAEGVAMFLQPAEELKEVETYQFDAVDMVRQFIADLGRNAYAKMVKAYNEKDLNTFTQESSRFLDLILDQDRLLSTHPHFHVGRWIAEARAASDNTIYKDLYEKNARLLITTWSDKNTTLRDYAHREWGGLLKDFYYPRWAKYVHYLKGQLNGKSLVEPDFFGMEIDWVNDRKVYKTSSENPIETALMIFHKYHQ